MKIFGQNYETIVLLIVMLGLPGISIAEPTMFGRFTTDRATLYAGEAFRLTLAIHVSGEMLDKQINIANLPAPPDFQLRAFEELPIETVTLDGRMYEVRKFRSWARVLKAGSLALAPRLEGTLVQTTRSFFMMQETRRSTSIPVEPYSLTLKPLPLTGRPANFSGLAGDFTFALRAEPLDIAAGDLITMTFTIEGDWLPDTFDKPVLQTGDGLKAYDFKPVPGDSSPNRLVYQQTIIPENTAVTAIPACSFCYFDTRAARYKTLTKGPFKVRYHSEHAAIQEIYAPTQSEAVTSTQTVVTTPGPDRPKAWWARLWCRISGKQEFLARGNTDLVVRFAPSETAQELFTIKPGLLVTKDGEAGDWIRISCPKGIGWLPKSALQ